MKIGTNDLEIEAKQEDCTTADVIPLVRAFHVYTQILVFLAAPAIKLQLQLALGKYADNVVGDVYLGLRLRIPFCVAS